MSGSGIPPCQTESGIFSGPMPCGICMHRDTAGKDLSSRKAQRGRCSASPRKTRCAHANNVGTEMMSLHTPTGFMIWIGGRSRVHSVTRILRTARNLPRRALSATACCFRLSSSPEAKPFFSGRQGQKRRRSRDFATSRRTNPRRCWRSSSQR